MLPTGGLAAVATDKTPLAVFKTICPCESRPVTVPRIMLPTARRATASGGSATVPDTP
jgi:hypothetical protein